MEEDEDDDIYAPEDVITISEKVDIPIARIEKKGDDLEEGEEEGEELDEDASDSVYQDEMSRLPSCCVLISICRI